MRILFALPALLALAACATPREACINDITGPLREVNRQIALSQESIARGYNVDTRREYRMVEQICRDRNDAGEVVSYECRRPEWVDTPIRVPLNRQAEDARLASLLQQRDTIQQQIAPGIAACTAAHPE